MLTTSQKYCKSIIRKKKPKCIIDAALIVIDMQNDFLPHGALAVSNNVCETEIMIAKINKLLKLPFKRVIFTQDWHPLDHVSFAANHRLKNVNDTITFKLNDGTEINQVLWPVHCVQNTYGAEISSEINIPCDAYIIKKGTNKLIDSYSGFGDNHDKKYEKTNLENLLTINNDIYTVFIVGLAFDYCVGFTALDAAKLGFKTYIIKDATQSITSKSELAMIKQLIKAGVKIIDYKEFMCIKSQFIPTNSTQKCIK